MRTEVVLSVLRHALGGAGVPRETDDWARLSDADWAEIAGDLARLDIAPLVYRSFHSPGGRPDMPPAAIDRLREAYVRTGIRNTRLYDDFREVTQALAGQQIGCIALKGVHLADAFYGDIAARPMKDIDILVRRADLPKAERALLQLGYGPAGRPPIEAQCSHHHLVPFTKAGRAPLEVHWSILVPDLAQSIPEGDLWKRAGRSSIRGAQVLTLCPEDLLLHLCMHFATDQKNRRFEVRGIADVCTVLGRCSPEIDWGLLAAVANASGLSGIVYAVLRLAATLLGAPVPPGALDRLSHNGLDLQVSEALAEHLLSQPSIRVPDPLRRFAGEESLKERMRILARYGMPSDAYLREKFPLLEGTGRASRRRAYLAEVFRRVAEMARHIGLRTGEGMAVIDFERKRSAIEKRFADAQSTGKERMKEAGSEPDPCDVSGKRRS